MMGQVPLPRESETVALKADGGETPYGARKRLAYLTHLIEVHQPRRILDVGCGTGALLTHPLAVRFPSKAFLGVDVHRPTIEFAQAAFQLSNLRFSTSDELGEGPFDLIIASEVMEHVGDPMMFLASLRTLLSPEGRIFLTIPNGYGPFEFMSLVEDVLYISGVYRLVRWLKRRVRPSGGDPRAGQGRDTLAIDPHVNFLSFGALLTLLQRAGLRVEAYRPRTFLCGFGLDHLVAPPVLARLNARVADFLPPFMASDWMFLVKPVGTPAAHGYRRSLYARLHRYSNRTRWRHV